MSTITGPVALTLGQSSQLPLPASGQYQSVAIANQSGYLLEVNVGAQTAWLAPWTADLYVVAGNTQSPIICTPQLLPGSSIPAGSSSAATATWYTPGEQVQGTYPVSLTANAIAAAIAGAVSVTGGTINNQQPQQLLGTIQWGKNPSASATYALPTATQSLFIATTNQVGPVQVTVVGTATGVVYFNQVIAPNDWELSPVSPAIDPSVTVTAVTQGGGSVNPPQNIYTIARIDPALTQLAGVIPGYETGRYQPVIPSSAGILQQAVGSGSGAFTLLPAFTSPPAYPNQYRIWAATLRVASNSATALCNGVLIVNNGVTQAPLLAIEAYGAGSANQGYDGLILPVGASVTVNLTGTSPTVAASIFYDAISTS